MARRTRSIQQPVLPPGTGGTTVLEPEFSTDTDGRALRLPSLNRQCLRGFLIASTGGRADLVHSAGIDIDSIVLVGTNRAVVRVLRTPRAGCSANSKIGSVSAFGIAHSSHPVALPKRSRSLTKGTGLRLRGPKRRAGSVESGLTWRFSARRSDGNGSASGTGRRPYLRTLRPYWSERSTMKQGVSAASSRGATGPTCRGRRSGAVPLSPLP